MDAGRGGRVTLRLEGHRAAVVGAGGAIGTAICRAYADAGAAVAALDIDEAAAKRALDGLAGGGHGSWRVDVTDAASAEAGAEAACVVDSVVYCAGVAFTADVADTDWASYRALMAVNLDGAFHVAAAFVRRMLARGGEGSFAFLSSTAGLRGEAGASAYCASKFGLRGLVESFAAELSGSGIRVNAICPGNVDSPLLRAVARDVAEREGASVDETMERFAHAGGARRLVSPEEVAGTAVWLASPLARGVTGESVRVDAGQLVG
jgi:NAD(P)-dependent dehydrogenase (short-subunit alcohol dehydrogenase family)